MSPDLAGGAVVKYLPANARDMSLVPGSGRPPWSRKWQTTSCLENPMDRGAWQATVHGVARVRHD